MSFPGARARAPRLTRLARRRLALAVGGLALLFTMAITACPHVAETPTAGVAFDANELALEQWIARSGWRGSTALYRQVYDCGLLDRDAMLVAAASLDQLDCAFEMNEQACLADWEGAGNTWKRCCADVEPQPAFCQTAFEQMPELPSAVELYRLYAEHAYAVDYGYYERGTTRSVEVEQLPPDIAEQVGFLHEGFSALEKTLMLEHGNPAPKDALPICIGSGHNWGYYCWKRYGLRGALLVHVDSHADMAADKTYPQLDRERTPQDWVQLVSRVDIDEFIQPALVDGTLWPGALYWVIPPWTEPHYDYTDYALSLCQAADGPILSYSPDLDYDGFSHGIDKEEAFHADRQTAECSELVETRLRVVKHVSDAAVDLRAGMPLVLDVDLDYFGTTSPLSEEEPGALPERCPPPAELEGMLHRFAGEVWALPKPAVVSIALSPDFTCGNTRKLLARVLAILEQRWAADDPRSGPLEVLR